jgi:hypothetical protein
MPPTSVDRPVGSASSGDMLPHERDGVDILDAAGQRDTTVGACYALPTRVWPNSILEAAGQQQQQCIGEVA